MGDNRNGLAGRPRERPGNTMGASKGKTSTGKGTTTNRQGYASFNRERARGRYEELETRDSTSDSESEDGTGGGDDAPYAYDGAVGRQEKRAAGSVDEDRRITTVGKPRMSNHPVVAMEVDSVDSSIVSGYVGSSALSQPCSYASTHGSELTFSLESEKDDNKENTEDNPPSRRVAVTDASGKSSAMAQDSTDAQPTPADALTLNQDEVVMEKTVHPPGMPQQLPAFIRPFAGTLIEVPANGQCAYSALYATTSYIDGGVLHFTSEVVRNSNAIKRSVYTLMMTNLAQDVECGIVDPIRELKRLYPLQPAPAGKETATASLYSHYAQERVRSVNTHIPSDFWAGAEVLRAMAQYLREPLMVFDVDAHNDTHAQRYYYKTYRTDNGRPHETGCGGAIDDQSATKLLQYYASLHVLPVMMVMKRHEGHFYGVHHGDLATRWIAEGDRQFAEMNCATHPWFDEVIAHLDYSGPRMPSVNRLDVTEEVDGVLIGGMEHRDRLDVVHERMGLPRLDGTALDIDYLEGKLRAEGARLQNATGSTYEKTATSTANAGLSPTVGKQHRFPIATHGRVAYPPLQRILDSINLEPELVSDRSKLRQLLQANAEAVAAWGRHDSRTERPDPVMMGPRGLVSMMPWLLDHRSELHSLFAFLPYPELAAKQLPLKLLRRWGSLEVYDVMIAAISSTLHDPTASAEAAEHCRKWLAACTLNGGDLQDRTIAGETHRWNRLQQLHPTASGGARSQNITQGCWAILHTLPYTIWAWPATAMGGVPRGQLGHMFYGQPAVGQLCERIDARAAWGSAIALPCGLTWDDRLTSMEVGLAARPHY